MSTVPEPLELGSWGTWEVRDRVYYRSREFRDRANVEADVDDTTLSKSHPHLQDENDRRYRHDHAHDDTIAPLPTEKQAQSSQERLPVSKYIGSESELDIFQT